MTSKTKYFTGILAISAFYMAFSLLTYKQYGITSDEQVEYESGRVLLQYIQTGQEEENDFISERHLPTNSTYFRGHLALFSLLNPNAYYEQSHLLNMIFALPIFLMFYSLLYFRYRDSLISGIGTLALVLTPRFFGDIPANPKDVPFAVFFFLSLGLIYLLEKIKLNSILKILVLGAMFGITAAFRLPGASLPVIYLLYTIFVTKSFKFQSALPIFMVAVLVFIKSLPLFSGGIAEGFRALIDSASNFEYWNNKMLFMGEFLTKEERPISYLPVWILISTPLFVLIPFILSPAVYFFGKIRERGLYILMLLGLGVNFALYLIINPIIYNGLRHFLFLVPIITFVGVTAVLDMRPNLWPKVALGILVLLAVRSFISLHPYQYIYFNELAGGLAGAAGRFDTDYWGAAYKESSEWASDNFSREGGVDVFVCDMAFAVEYYSRNEFRLTGEQDEAELVICDLDNMLQSEKDFPIIYTVEREGVPLNVVMQK